MAFRLHGIESVRIRSVQTNIDLCPRSSVGLEHETSNFVVAGSSPAGGTNQTITNTRSEDDKEKAKWSVG